MPFKLRAPYEPTGDQPAAIESLTEALANGARHQLLLGATGTGKTFTVANVVAKLDRPTLVLAPNKTLAVQLFGEFRQLFPENAVEYFVSYYDYYQPEAYLPGTDTFIEKDALINDEIDRLRHSATRSVLERNDVLVVASVSCIYGIGGSDTYGGMTLDAQVGDEVDRDALVKRLVELQYERNDVSFERGRFRVRGDTVEVFPVYEEDRALRISWFGDEIEQIQVVDPLRGAVVEPIEKIRMFPASHYVTPPEKMARAIRSIERELAERLEEYRKEGRMLELQRLEQRTRYDLEMLQTVGTVKGIENYSRHLSGRNPGEPPPTLLEYFPDNALIVIDESHQTIPQVGAMYKGDRSRKETLVEHGFRLPSALDNRPLTFGEFEKRVKQALYVSATPADYELNACEGVIVEQVIRPTGLLDPAVEVRPAEGQVDDLLHQIRETVRAGWRVLVTTLTKRMAEDLTEYLQEADVRTRYLHSDIDTIERADILRDLRAGEFDVLIGINLLREGLDLPEVGLVAILDADKEGFLRAERSLIQTIGRAARNAEGRVIMYGDRVTGSMARAIKETDRRRARQTAYNEAHNITPRTVERENVDLRKMTGLTGGKSRAPSAPQPPGDRAALHEEMLRAAEALDFERAAELRDQLRTLQRAELGIESSSAPRRSPQRSAGRRRRRS